MLVALINNTWLQQIDQYIINEKKIKLVQTLLQWTKHKYYQCYRSQQLYLQSASILFLMVVLSLTMSNAAHNPATAGAKDFTRISKSPFKLLEQPPAVELMQPVEQVSNLPPLPSLTHRLHTLPGAHSKKVCGGTRKCSQECRWNYDNTCKCGTTAGLQNVQAIKYHFKSQGVRRFQSRFAGEQR